MPEAKIIETKYRGYSIYIVNRTMTVNKYYAIFDEDGIRATVLCLASIKACENVINTFINSQKRDQVLVY